MRNENIVPREPIEREVTPQAVPIGELRAAPGPETSIPDDTAVTNAKAAPSAERAGATSGPYRLLEPIGEGGMGVVFLAEQLRPVWRKVALKVVKPGLDTKQVIARFEAERQALAVM